MIVLDASAAVEWLLGRPGAPEVDSHIRTADTGVHAPSYLYVDVLSALRGLTLGRHLTAGRAEAALNDLNDLDIATHDPALFIWRTWSMRHNLSAYDGVYVALAETLDATLVTADARIASASGVNARVQVVGQ